MLAPLPNQDLTLVAQAALLQLIHKALEITQIRLGQ
jgi:hypothetical protein